MYYIFTSAFPHLPDILFLTRSKRKDWTVLLALCHREKKGFLFCCHFWDDMQELQQKSETKGLHLQLCLGLCFPQGIYSLCNSATSDFREEEETQIFPQKHDWITFMLYVLLNLQDIPKMQNIFKVSVMFSSFCSDLYSRKFSP